MASAFPGSSCSQGCLFSALSVWNMQALLRNRLTSHAKGSHVREDTKVTFVVLEGGNLQMHLVFPTACILTVVPNPELEVHQRSLWISSSKAPGMGAFIILMSHHKTGTVLHVPQQQPQLRLCYLTKMLGIQSIKSRSFLYTKVMPFCQALHRDCQGLLLLLKGAS